MIEFENLTDETVASISQLATKATGAEGKVYILPIPNHPDGDVLLVKPDGSYEEFPIPQPPRKSRLKSVDQVAAYVTNAVDRWDADPAVYYAPDGVSVRISDGNVLPENNGFARVDLVHSDQFKLLSRFATDRDTAFLPHAKFLRMLRLDLDSCFDPQVLEFVLRACAAYESEEGTRVASTVTRNRESLGREVMAELRAQNGEIPEDVVLQVRIFKDPSLLTTRRVHCKIETDPTGGGKFALLPFANELENAIDAEMADLGETLRLAINGNGNRLPDPNAEKVDGKLTVAPRYVPVFYGTF